MKTHKVALTDGELILLDGAVRAEVQAEVDRAKRRRAYGAAAEGGDVGDAEFVADAVSMALTADTTRPNGPGRGLLSVALIVDFPAKL